MLNELVICYLFLGGAGSGSLVVLCVLEAVDLAGASPPSGRAGAAASIERERGCVPADILRIAWPLCVAALAFSAVCLMFDLGRIDRVLDIFMTPAPSVMAIGAWALVASLACAGFMAARRLFGWDVLGRFALAACSCAGCAAGAVAAVYTGLLLSSMPSVAFWQTPLLPATFLLSSLSSGIALLFAACAFASVRNHAGKRRVALWLCRADAPIVLAEAACIAGILFMAKTSASAAASADALLVGEEAWVFWGGVVLCGVAAPLAAEAALVRGASDDLMLWTALLVLVGALALRICFIQAGAYDVTQNPRQAYGFAERIDMAGRSASVTLPHPYSPSPFEGTHP